MFENIQAFLGKRVSEYKAGILMSALHILNRYGEMGPVSEITQMLETSNDIDTSQLLLDTEVIINQGLVRILDAHLITVQGDIAIKVDILEGLKVLMDYEDSATILQFTDLSDDPVQTLSDLLAMVTDRTWADYSDAITNVSESLIKRLGELHRDKGEEDTAEPVVIEPARHLAIQKHLNSYLVSLTKHAALEDMVMIGTPFDMLVHRYKAELTELEPRAAKQAAIELVGFGLLSDVSLEDFTAKLKDKIDDIYADINFITQIDSEMDTVLKEVMAHG